MIHFVTYTKLFTRKKAVNRPNLKLIHIGLNLRCQGNLGENIRRSDIKELFTVLVKASKHQITLKSMSPSIFYFSWL